MLPLQVSSGAGCAVKSITFSRNGDSFIVNSMDRDLRIFKYLIEGRGRGGGEGGFIFLSVITSLTHLL